MIDGYPEESELEKIKNWPYEDRAGIIDFVESIWQSPDFGFRRDSGELKPSTGGWSGNEDIIEAMNSNIMFWAMCWVQSRRGGHYIFDLKVKGET